MAKRKETPTLTHPKTLLLGLQTPYQRVYDIDSYFQEFINLAKSNGIQNYLTLFMNIRSVDSGYFLTKGKLEQLREFCTTNQIEQLIVSEMLTPQQERNLSNMVECSVMDRAGLILSIFEKAAHSAEGKMQVAIAVLKHQKSRLAGRGISMSQQSGRIGTRGPGETAKERELQHIEGAISTLRGQLKKLQKTRDTQRKQRITNKLPLMCLVGYTNAGKSTILNLLTKSQVVAEDKLFATLDTTTRELYIDGSKIGLLSDTVGFIQQLPPQLIEAFKSTLSELIYADLLIHVIDASDSNFLSHIATVLTILNDLEIDKPMLYVFNKIDKVSDIERLQHTISRYQPHVLISSLTKEGLTPLVEALDQWHDTLISPISNENQS